MAGSKRMAFGVIAALLAASTVVMASLVKWAGEAEVSRSDVAQPPPMVPASPVEIPTSEPPPPAAAAPPPAQLVIDDKGFVDSEARCDATQSAVALGRTERSYVVICGETDGRYEYRGIRLSDDAYLTTAADATPTRGFLARNDEVVYSVSETELLITSGDTVIKQEPMLEFHGPR